MERVLVTGGCGFIGTNLVAKLCGQGFDVTVFDDMSTGSRSFLDAMIPKCTVIEGDVLESTLLEEVATGHQAIIHLAARGSVVESLKDPLHNYSVNVTGTFNALNAARNVGVGKFLLASTGGALIGNAEPPVSEQSIPRPISPYGASKLAAEGYCCAFANAYDMDVCALRFANVIGPVSWHKKGVVTAFIKSILDNTPIEIYGDGSATRDFIYVEDLVEGLVRALRKNISGYNVFHLASGKETSILELADKLCVIAGVLEPEIQFHNRRLGEVERNFASYDLASEILGFYPNFSIDDALSITLSWFKENYFKNDE